VFKAGATIDMPGITHVLSSGLHVGVLSAIDPNVNNLVAAGSLFTTTKQVRLTLDPLRLHTTGSPPDDEPVTGPHSAAHRNQPFGGHDPPYHSIREWPG
jgi:hypothetical protein